MSADVVIANFLRVADQDLEGAKVLATASNNRTAVYLCEQAAEKIIRAVLTAEGVHAGIRHQLDEMVDLVPDEIQSSPCSVPSNTSPLSPRRTAIQAPRGRSSRRLQRPTS